MSATPQQIFEYLLAIKNMTSPPIRDFREYDYFRFIEELPIGEGCYLYGSGEDEEAWLEVHKQSIPTVPKPDKMIAEWIKNDFTKESNLPEVHEQLKVDQTDDKDEDNFEAFSDDETRVELFNSWREEWDIWAEETRHKRAVQVLYGYLFALVQRLAREGETLELAIGHGMLDWSHKHGRISHPILISRIEIIFDAKKGMFLLKPTQRGTVLETEMLAGIDLPNLRRLAAMQKEVEEAALDPRDLETISHFYREFVHTLDPNGQYVETKIDKPAAFPIISEQPVLFLRKRSGQLWKEELRNVIEAINQGYEVPKSVQSLIQLETIQQNEQEKKEWSSVGEELLFPLPSNEDQKDIARRLSNHFGITVQGPPGTGKSHTIANLISHLLAHGKKVLVTSHTERALRVLSDKIPKDIRSLCVSVLGGDLRSLQEIEDSIRSISDQMSSLDIEKIDKEIKIYQQGLTETRKTIAELKYKLRHSAEKQHEKIDWEAQMITAVDAAKWLTAEQLTYEGIPDAIELHVLPPLSEQGMRRLWTLRGEISPEDSETVTKALPVLSDLLSPSEFSEWMDFGNQLEQNASSTQHVLDSYGFPLKKDFLSDVRIKVETILREKDIFQTPYLQSILDDLLAGGERNSNWIQLISYVKEVLDEINKLERHLSEYSITLPERPFHEMQQDISILEQRLKNGKTGKMYLLTTGRKVKYLVDQPIVNGKGVQTLHDVALVKEHLSCEEKRQKMVRKWNATLKPIDGPSFETNDQRLISKVDNIIKILNDTLKVFKKVEELKYTVKSLKLPSTFSWTSINSINDLHQAVEAVDWNLRKQEWDKNFLSRLHQIKEHIKPESPQIWNDLLQAFQSKDKAKWSFVYEETKRLLDVREQYQELIALCKRLEPAAPIWTKEIISILGTNLPYPDGWEKNWNWNRLNSWVTDINSYRPETIEAKLEEEQKQERRLIELIVSKSTWKKQLERITEPQKRALFAWKQKIKRIGKGTGKYAQKFRREAKEEMDQCRSAIPVWIMPIHRVIENFSLSEDMFDVVIVDESSQCDLFALSALLRAKKAVVVGDDEQISPAAVGVNQEEVRSLMARYLQDVPQSNSLDMQSSLYDVAVRIFPGNLMLKEHFRCVPEIIQFSNDLSYNGEIVPLRLPLDHERIEPAVLAKRVFGYRDEGKSINEVEAEDIVTDIKEMIQNPRFNGKSIGVISLQAEDQARFIENMLREEIGEEEMINRQIICGDAYAFQGDERDIMFLSMVVADNVRFAALTRKDAQQRFNVAASRAKNQMRLYHSVDLGDLNPNDMRYRLLNYCQNPMRTVEKYEEAEQYCESQFERDVLRIIVSRGYKIRPQVVVGRYRMDFVIEGIKKRLAVECDGDAWHGIDMWEEDRERQRDLERVGWTFWRVRGSEFYRDRKKAMESLWTKLKEMGIEGENEQEINVS